MVPGVFGLYGPPGAGVCCLHESDPSVCGLLAASPSSRLRYSTVHLPAFLHSGLLLQFVTGSGGPLCLLL